MVNAFNAKHALSAVDKKHHPANVKLSHPNVSIKPILPITTVGPGQMDEGSQRCMDLEPPTVVRSSPSPTHQYDFLLSQAKPPKEISSIIKKKIKAKRGSTQIKISQLDLRKNLSWPSC